MRLRAIEATKAGMKATNLALAYGVHRRTVFRWLADYYKGGEQALKAKPIPGRPPKLDEPQMQSLAQAVTDQTPLQHGFQIGLWTQSILHELIRRQFGQTMEHCPRSFLQRLMVGATNPVFVVGDGHPVHKSALVRHYIASQAGQLQLFFLPPYSPQLNPDEQV